MSIGIWQLVLILLIIFVLFGAGKLPSVMKDFGKSVKNLKDGLNGTDEPDPAPVSLNNAQAEEAKPK